MRESHSSMNQQAYESIIGKKIYGVLGSFDKLSHIMQRLKNIIRHVD
jgi:hypothetical protein